jgi:hypothetical protein
MQAIGDGRSIPRERVGRIRVKPAEVRAVEPELDTGNGDVVARIGRDGD